MNTARGLGIIAACALACCGAHAAVFHRGQTLLDIASPDVTRPCLFFRLVGVAQADPTSPNPTTTWFAVPTDAVGNVPSVKYQEISRMIYQAKATGATISVKTTGAVVPACSNFVDVDYAILQ
jgi:hypothetical protein